MPPSLFLPRRHAFTLIELLTVITIIAILTAILVPVAGNMRNRANQTTSINNLKQWASALGASLSDFDNSLPSDGGSGGGANLGDPDAWFIRLPRYLGIPALNSPEVQANPVRPGQKSLWINPAVPTSEGGSATPFFCYGMNDFLTSATDSTLKMTRVERSAATVFMSEKGDGLPTVTPQFVRAYFGGGDPGRDLDNEANFLFCDGHVVTMKRRIFQNPLALGLNPIDPNYTFIPFPEATP